MRKSTKAGIITLCAVLAALSPLLASFIQTGIGNGATLTSGVYASAPTCLTSQFIYVTTDAGLIEYCNGSSVLTKKYGLFSVVPPNLGDTSWFNQTSAVITAVPAGLVVDGTALGTNNVQARVQAFPSTPFTQIACLDHAVPDNNFGVAGMFFSNGTNIATSLLTMVGVGVSSSAVAGTLGASPQVFVQRYTNVTTAAANPTYATLALTGAPLCLAMQDDGTTNRKMAFSYDRQNWYVVITEGRTAFLTPADIGFFVNTGSSSQIPHIHLVSWELVASTLF